jgi:hypothetical protein
LKSVTALWARNEEGPGESRSDHEGCGLASSGIRALKYFLYISGERSEGERESTLIHMTCVRVVLEWGRLFLSIEEEKRISTCRPEEKGNCLIEKTGMPEEEEGRQGIRK